MPFCASKTSIFNPSDHTETALACCRYSCLTVHEALTEKYRQVTQLIVIQTIDIQSLHQFRLLIA